MDGDDNLKYVTVEKVKNYGFPACWMKSHGWDKVKVILLEY